MAFMSESERTSYLENLQRAFDRLNAAYAELKKQAAEKDKRIFELEANATEIHNALKEVMASVDYFPHSADPECTVDYFAMKKLDHYLSLTYPTAERMMKMLKAGIEAERIARMANELFYGSSYVFDAAYKEWLEASK
jgi:hypothetical protein